MAHSTFSKEEKKFWQKQYHIEKSSDIFPDWTLFKSIDGNEDDAFFYFLTLRVTSITDLFLKESLITDKGIAYLCNFKELKHLYLRNHSTITNKSIPYFNKMACLESLNITKTKITLTDLSNSLNNQSLKEVFLDSEENETDLEEKAFILKERMPNCNIYLDCSFTTDSFGNIEKPIF